MKNQVIMIMMMKMMIMIMMHFNNGINKDYSDDDNNQSDDFCNPKKDVPVLKTMIKVMTFNLN